MVKGVARQVVTVKSPDPKLFEEAIFFVRDEALRSCGPDELLREAQQIAGRYLHRPFPIRSRLRYWPLAAAFLGGVASASLFFLLSPIF